MISRKNRAIDIRLPKDQGKKRPKAKPKLKAKKNSGGATTATQFRTPAASVPLPLYEELIPKEVVPDTWEEIPDTDFEKPKPKVKAKSKTVYDCEVCGLFQNAKSPEMKYSGTGLKQILIIGEAPGAEEDRAGQPFIGEAGKLLRFELRKVGIDLQRDCWITNAVRCRPPGNKKPTRKQQKCCYETFLEKEIRQLNPKFIILVGGTAVESFWNRMFSNLTITRWRGLCVPEQTRFNSWILPIYHPSYILRNEDDIHLKLTWQRDIKRAASVTRKKSRPLNGDYSFWELAEDEIKLLIDFESIRNYLKKILNKKLEIAFDYETSSISPYNDPDPKVWSINVSTSRFTIAFPFDHPEAGFTNDDYYEIKSLWIEILNNPNVSKIAHNLKFEEIWSRVVFGVRTVVGWLTCTMNTAHILDSRINFSGLKFQGYVNFGIPPYDESIRPFMKSGEGSRNNLDKAPLSDLLTYGGLDAWITFALAEVQGKKIRPGSLLEEARVFFLEGLKTLAETQHNGLCIDPVYFEEVEKKLSINIAKSETQIENSKEAKLFEEMKERPFKRKAKDYSTKDMRELFFDVLGLTSIKKTAKDFDSVDREVLESLKNPVARKLLERRKLIKIRDTYLSQFRKEKSKDDTVHPFIDLHTAASYRSSSSKPNIQNQPIRDKVTKKYVRDGVFPHWGDRLAEVDYGSLEVRIIACESQDPTLVNYILNPTTDMHRDQAMNIFKLNEQQLTGELRFFAKNGFVFPEFYGSYFKACAANLWQNCMGLKTGEEVTVKKHLRNEGIRRYDDFEEHIKDCEQDFWGKFPVVKEWQLKSVERYKKLGYVEMRFGFRRSGHLSFNQIVNGKIQGTAFHLLLYAMMDVNNTIARQGLQSKTMWEIHDSIGISVNPKEVGKICRIINESMVVKPARKFDWLIVPLDIDVKIGRINEPWSEIEDMDFKKYLRKK